MIIVRITKHQRTTRWVSHPNSQGNRKIKRGLGLFPCRQDCGRLCGTWMVTPALMVVSCRSRLSAMRGSRHRLREAWPVRTRLLSSRKSTSKRHYRPYSIQCAFAVANKCWTSGIGRDETTSFDADLISHPLLHSHLQKTARVGPVSLQVHIPQMLRVANGARPRRISMRP